MFVSGWYLVNVRRKKTVRMKSVSVITISGTNHAHARPQATGTACAPRGRPRTRTRVAEGARIHANWLGSVPDKLQHRACTVVWQRAMALSMSTNMRCAHRNRTVKLAARSGSRYERIHLRVTNAGRFAQPGS